MSSSENNKNLPYFGTSIEFSPMTEISINLSGTKISKLVGTRKRRLSLSDEENCETFDFTENLTTGRKCFQDITNISTAHDCSSPPKRMTKTTTNNTLILDSDPTCEVSLYGGATPETRSPECSPEISKKYSYHHRSSDLECIESNRSIDRSSRSLLFSPKLATTPGSNGNSSRLLFRGLSDFEHSVQDDEFMLLVDDDDDDENKLPINFNQLVSGNILHKSPPTQLDISGGGGGNKTPKVRNRLFSTVNDSSSTTTPLTTHQRSPLKLPLKRSKSLFDNNDGTIKRSRTTEDSSSGSGVASMAPLPLLRRSISINCSPNTAIMSAVYRSTIEPDLIGDFSRPFVLPLVTSGQRHQDLKSITASTLSRLVQGDFDDAIQSYKIIDCRYPYEYNGGHIRGAINYYTKDHIDRELFNKTILSTVVQSTCATKRNIIIFHCEFSAQRGPKLFRYLRALDRNHNNDIYPHLYYPEIYLLEGGYKRFYEQFSELCEPIGYMRMDDPAHEVECRLFRAQKRSQSALTQTNSSHTDDCNQSTSCIHTNYNNYNTNTNNTLLATSANSTTTTATRKLLTKRSALEF